MFKQALKSTASTIAPSAWLAFTSARARAHSHRLIAQWGLPELNQRIVHVSGRRVLSGPFAGLLLGDMAMRDHVGPFLLGTYEMELHPWWYEIFRGNFGQILDIGSRFGFYAVALALRFPDSSVIAFDPDHWARRATRETISLNGAENVRIERECTPSWLQKHLRDHALIVSDCEGFEDQLFCSTNIGALATSTLLVEMHEEASPGVSSRLRERFARTHHLRTVESISAKLFVGNNVWGLNDSDLTRAANETRPHQEWAFFQPKLDT